SKSSLMALNGKKNKDHSNSGAFGALINTKQWRLRGANYRQASLTEENKSLDTSGSLFRLLTIVKLPALLGRYDFTLKHILLNAIPFQRLFGEKYLIGVFWTLEMEIKFYLTTTLLWWIFGSLNKSRHIISFSLFKFIETAWLF
ncbi:MAG: hypothetical protein WBD50_06100, partial [Candidatus Rhabdochlamydia sp.]